MSLKKLKLISGFIYYLIGDAYYEDGNLHSSYKALLKVDEHCVYYKKARARAYDYMYKLRYYKKILKTRDTLNLPVTRFYKAKTSLFLKNIKDFKKHIISLFEATPPYKLWKKSILLWSNAGRVYLNDKANFALARIALFTNKIPAALHAVEQIKKHTIEVMDLKASILLRKGYSPEIKKLYKQIINSNHELKQKAEYMYFRCFSFEGNITGYIDGMKKIVNNQKHKFRVKALKILLAYSAENKKIEYKYVEKLPKKSFHDPDYFHYLAAKIYPDKQNVIKLAKYFLNHNENHKFKSFLNNFLAEMYIQTGRKKIALEHYKKSAILSSNFYANLSYLELLDSSYPIKKINRAIHYSLKRQKQNFSEDIKKLINTMKSAPTYKSKKADLYLKIGDKRRLWLLTINYLRDKGFENVLGVIKYFINNGFLPTPSEYSLHLKNYLYSKGVALTFYKDIADISFPHVYNFLFKKSQLKGFLKAVVFGESFFHEFAHSRAGAIGYTQKMPATARWIAKDKNLAIHKIFNPELNIDFGEKFMAWLLKKYENRIYALGSYNAGPTRFRRYIKRYRKKSMTPAHFVEKIPLDETRGYIVKTINAYAFLLVCGK